MAHEHERPPGTTGARAVGEETGAAAQPQTSPPREVSRDTIAAPGDEHVVYRAEPSDVVGASRQRFDLPATLGGALAALGALALLSGILGAVVGSIGYQTGVDGRDLSVGGLVAGLVALFLACLAGGWVAGRIARHRGGLHGLVAVLWLVVLAAVLGVLAAVAGDRLDARERVGLPDWFSADTLTAAAIVTGLVALALALLGGWLGGRLGERHRHSAAVEVVERRRDVRRHPGGIVAEDGHDSQVGGRR